MEIEEFINGALVSWLESCLPRPEILTGYASLLDGSLIHSVWLQIDPEPPNHPAELMPSDMATPALCVQRAKNFECIIGNLKSLFEEEFHQTILVLPDSYTLGYAPETKNGLEQMKTLLTLLLGAAVQCPNKEIFIGRIKELDVTTQHAIVGLIKQVTDNHSLVLTEESVNLLTPTALYEHVRRLTRERDAVYSKWFAALAARPPEVDLSGCGGSGGTATGDANAASAVAPISPASPPGHDSNHMNVELADLKSKLRKLRQELEEKVEGQLELREELDHKSVQYEKLRAESQEWYAEARRAAAYRDEVDVLRERAERADRLEMELQKFREKLTDAEFYKTRVEELREDNRMLLETKEMLEDQLQRSRKRSEHAMSLESEIIKYKQRLNDMSLERDVDRGKLEELLEENTQLQLVAKNLNATQDLDKSCSDNEDECASGDNSLSEQLTNNAQTRALKLELENRRLAAALEQLQESSFHESTQKILELEKDKKRLSLKVDQMQENAQRLAQQNAELENVFRNALDENRKLQDSLDARQKAHERQSVERDAERQKLNDLEQHVETLNKEKQRIQTLNESIQRRAGDLERLLEARVQEVTAKSTDCDAAKAALYEMEAKFSAAERENASLAREATKLKENLEAMSVQLDQTVEQFDQQCKEVERLTKAYEGAAETHARIAEMEKQNQELVSQREIDAETIATLRKDLVCGTLATHRVRDNLEKLGLGGVDTPETTSDPLNVATVVEKIVRHNFKTVREVFLNVCREKDEASDTPEYEKSDICVLCHRKEIYTVEKNIELSVDSEKPTSQELHFEHKVQRRSPDTELARLGELNTQLNAANVELQSSGEQLRAENARLSVDVATLGSQISSLSTQHVAQQLANSQLAAEKDILLKQLEGVRGELKTLLHDQVTLQCLHDQLAAEYESLNKDKESLKATVRDLRNEARELRDLIASLEQQLAEVTQERAALKSCGDDLATMRTEHSKLTEDFRNLFATSDRLKNEYKNIQEQYKRIRLENSKLRLQNTELSGELGARTDQAKTREFEYTKVTQKCEMLLQMNADLDTDRRTLMDNVSQLLSQYHELLSHSLEDKQHFHEEEKSYTERVHNLSRQKEKLEEKIMEHYRKSDSAHPKKKPFASGLVRRVKKASSDLMNKVPSRNRRSWVDDTRQQPPSSPCLIGSESGGNEDSDNSNEEPLSIASDTHLLQRNLPMRQSLQRLEPPDVTGSSLTLGTAGSRRTVYLIDEAQKLPDSNNGNAAPPNANTSTIGTTTAEPQTPAAATPTNTGSPPGTPEVPATFLMYNRINTMIGTGPAAEAANTASATTTPTTAPQDDKLLRKHTRTEDKSNSIWYEYGCV